MDPFELRNSPVDDLSYDYARGSVFKGRFHDLEGLRNESGSHTMLALMLSDQCPWGITVTDPDGNVTRITGSVLSHPGKTIPLVNANNPKKTVDGSRAPVDRFPRSSVREAVINAVAHRDYSVDDDVRITVDDDGVTVESPGSAFRSDSVRNPNLVRIMEAYRLKGFQDGGLRGIVKSYSRSGYEPRMVSRRDSFMVYLPAVHRVLGFHESRIKRVTDFMRGKGGVTTDQIAHHMTLSTGYMNEVLSDLETEGVVFSMYTGSRRRYYLCSGREASDISELTQIRDR